MNLTAALLCMIQLALATPQHQSQPPPPPSQLPPPPSQLPPPPLSSHPAPITPTLPPVPLPPTTTSKGAPPPPSNGPQPNGPICECGYTYCSSVLMAMKVPWSQTQLAEAYCKTPSAACTNNSPATNVTSALYLCLCDDIDQEVGNQLHLICGCDKCLNVGPDFRGRCETPCHAGSCSG